MTWLDMSSESGLLQSSARLAGKECAIVKVHCVSLLFMSNVLIWVLLDARTVSALPCLRTHQSLKSESPGISAHMPSNTLSPCPSVPVSTLSISCFPCPDLCYFSWLSLPMNTHTHSDRRCGAALLYCFGQLFSCLSLELPLFRNWHHVKRVKK